MTWEIDESETAEATGDSRLDFMHKEKAELSL
jgi:hypothetical protein